MIGYVFSYVLALLLLIGGGRNHTDLLDTVSTGVYWQLKHVTPDLAQLQKDAGIDPAPASIDPLLKDLESADFTTRDNARQNLERLGPAILPLLQPALESKDAEVAAVVQDLARKFTERGQERAIRQLMAIRTLGERKEKDALPQLKELQDSKQLFVADYAARSIAQINGVEPPALDVTAGMSADLALLPANSAILAQTTGIASERLTIASLVEKALAADRMANMPAQPPRPQPDLVTRHATEKLLTFLEQIGNVRFDGVTVALNYTKEDKPDATEHGWVVLILRGEYDAATAMQAFKREVGEEAIITLAQKPGDVTTIREKEGDTILLLPDSQHVIMINGTKGDSQAACDALLAALKTGKGTLEENKDLAAMLKTIDLKSPAWAVGKLSDALSKELTDGAFKTFTVEAKTAKEGGGTEFTIKGEAIDADKAKTTVVMFTDAIKSTQDDLKQEVVLRPNMKPVTDLMASIKVSSEGVTATMTGEVPAGMLGALMGEIPLLEMLEMSDVATPMAPAEIQPMEAIPEQAMTQPAPRN